MGAQQVRTQAAAISHSLSWTPGHLTVSHFAGVGMTGTSEETPVVAPKKEEVVKLSNSFKEACVLTKSELVRNLLLAVVSIYFICKYVGSDIPTDHFLLNNIFIPLFVYNIIMILCTAYYIFALTQSTVRYLYVEVFYVNIFRKLVVIFFCTYMLVVIFSPHHFYVSSSREGTGTAELSFEVLVRPIAHHDWSGLATGVLLSPLPSPPFPPHLPHLPATCPCQGNHFDVVPQKRDLCANGLED